MLAPRLSRLPSHDIGGGLVVLEARGFRARLLGLAFLRELPAGHALLIPRCSSVHTFGMRFRLDVAFLGADGAVVRVDSGVPRRRVLRCRGAHAVLETTAGDHEAVYRLLDTG
jgi:uncharacterized membrane protein (UPF0127 family)